MAKHRTYSIAFKRQVAQTYLSSKESYHGLARDGGWTTELALPATRLSRDCGAR